MYANNASEIERECLLWHKPGGYVSSGLPWIYQFTYTCLSNFAMIPALRFAWKSGCYVDALVGGCAFVTSFCFHYLQVTGGNIFGTEEIHWHIADNVFALACSAGCASYLVQHPSAWRMDIIKTFVLCYAGLIISLDSMTPATMLGAIVFPWIAVAGYRIMLLRRRSVWYRQLRFQGVKRNLLLIFMTVPVAFFCFVIGMDAQKDPFRLLHGLWHVAFSIFVYSLLHMTHPPSIVAERLLQQRLAKDLAVIAVSRPAPNQPKENYYEILEKELLSLLRRRLKVSEDCESDVESEMYKVDLASTKSVQRSDVSTASSTDERPPVRVPGFDVDC